jgi:hypothetical protein
MNRPRFAIASLLILALAPAARSDEPTLSMKELDWRIDQAVYHAIVAGVPLYEQREFTACYRLYQGALIAVEPFLAHRAELRETVTKGLKEAPAARTDAARAIELRKVLDAVLAGVRNPPPAPAPAAPPSPTTRPTSTSRTRQAFRSTPLPTAPATRHSSKGTAARPMPS